MFLTNSCQPLATTEVPGAMPARSVWMIAVVVALHPVWSGERATARVGHAGPRAGIAKPIRLRGGLACVPASPPSSQGLAAAQVVELADSLQEAAGALATCAPADMASFATPSAVNRALAAMRALPAATRASILPALIRNGLARVGTWTKTDTSDSLNFFYLPAFMAGREVGVIVGGGALKEHLTKTTDAKAAIHSWVAQNSLETPSCQPAHELLDSMGFSRADQHKGVMNHLKDRLLARIDTMPQEMKLALLEKCFPYVTIPELRAVPVEILSKLPRVPVAYFAEIAKDAKLMSELPLAVRRQVWVQKVNPELFKSYILSLIRQYSLQPPLLGLVTGMKGASTKFKKARAANKALQDIVSACADVAPLYRETLDIIGQAYLDNPSDLALCSLRLQLPLAALEAGTKHVADTDASYKLAKCLCDAARDKDMKEAQVLKSLTDAQDMAKNLRPLQAAMLLRAPETTEFVTSALLAACRRVAENQSIPKQDFIQPYWCAWLMICCARAPARVRGPRACAALGGVVAF